jgi:hypothetical protein
LLGLGDVPAREVAAADVKDLACGDGDADRLPDLVPRSSPVNMAELVEVDVAGLQPGKARIQRAADVQR